MSLEDIVGGQHESLTIEELLTLPNTGPDPGSQGFVSTDAIEYHRQYGEPIRWWKGYRAPEGAAGPNGEVRERNGRIYIEQVIPDEVRALFSQTKREIVDAEFGLFTRGQSQISVIPHEITFARGDRVLRIHPKQAWLDRCILSGTGTNASELTQLFVSEVQTVIENGEVIDPREYELEVTPAGKSYLTRNSSAPAIVEFKFAPRYSWLNIESRSAPLGTDGEQLPQIGILTQDQPKI